MNQYQYQCLNLTARALLACWLMIFAASAWPQASWVGDVLIGGEPSNFWTSCNPCNPEGPPNTNWSNDRIPGHDGPLGDPGTGAVIGSDFVVDTAGGSTLDLSTLNVQGGLIVGGLINISESALINNIDLESGGVLAGPGPVTLTGTGIWNGFLRSGAGVTNQATLTVVTGDLETDLINNATLVINPSLNFTSAPSLLTNNGNILLNTDTALSNSSDILFGAFGTPNLLLNQATIAKFGAHLSVIEAPGNHAGGLISASDGTLRFNPSDWEFSGGGMQVSNNGQIELTGNVDHVFNGTPGISGQGNLLINMATFGTLTATQPFVVDLTGDPGLILQGSGINLESALTNRQGGRWSGGTISGTGAGRLVNESPLSNPFRIVPGSSKTLNGNLDSTGWIEQSSNVRVNAPHRLSIGSGGGLEILNGPSSIDWNGDGEVVNAGEVKVQAGAQSRIPAGFSQAEGGQLLVEGKLDLRGGGMWSGNTDTVVKGAGTLEFRNQRFEFGSGTHSFSEEDSVVPLAPFQISFAELITTAPDALVIFDLGFAEMLSGSAIGGSGGFENRKSFNWASGEFGIDGMIEFTNAAGSFLLIGGSGNLLDGILDNQGDVVGSIRLTSDAVVNNSPGATWRLLNDTIGTTHPGNPGQFNNLGDLSAIIDGPESRIDARLNNSGAVFVGSKATLRINGPVEQLQNGVLSGGTWAIGSDATLIFPEPFDTIGPGTVIRGLEAIDGIEALAHILAGKATVTGVLNVNDGLELNNGGRIIFDGQSSVNVPGGVQNGEPGQQPSIIEMLEEAIVIASQPESRIARGSELTPILTTPLLDNHAVIAPGGVGLPGPFNLDGELVMHPGSTLAIDIAGTEPIDGHDLLTVTGSVELGGKLEIMLAEAFTPEIGQQFVIATANAFTGSFSDLVTTNRPDIIWNLVESEDQVILTIADIALFSDRFEAP